ncbi:MAG: aminoacyl-tRNA deacylase [Bacteriovoracaceae bacterium]|nr:aminoacyl-tRNA deacylase [Bacteroidota bacterium]
MTTIEYPITTGVRFLRNQNIAFVPYVYAYEHRGGTATSARELGIDEHRIIKTLVMEIDPRNQFLVLMHGDKEVSTKQLARTLNVKSVSPVSEQTAQRVTGYQVGGISPFGTKQRLPVYAEQSIFALPQIVINGGKRGFLVEVDTADVQRVLNVMVVNVAV